jgi:hypothetical protein
MIVVLPLHIAVGKLRNGGTLVGNEFANVQFWIALGIGILWAIIGWASSRKVFLHPVEYAPMAKALNFATVGNMILLLAIAVAFFRLIPSGGLLIFPILCATAFLIGIPIASSIIRRGKNRGSKIPVNSGA